MARMRKINGIECKPVPDVIGVCVSKAGDVFVNGTLMSKTHSATGGDRVYHGFEGVTVLVRRLIALAWIPCLDANGDPINISKMRVCLKDSTLPDPEVYDNLEWLSLPQVYRKIVTDGHGRAIPVFARYGLTGDVVEMKEPSETLEFTGLDCRTVSNALTREDPCVSHNGYTLSYSRDGVDSKVEYTLAEIRRVGDVKLTNTSTGDNITAPSINILSKNPHFDNFGLPVHIMYYLIKTMGSCLNDELELTFIIAGKEFHIPKPPDGSEVNFSPKKDARKIHTFDAFTGQTGVYDRIADVCGSLGTDKVSVLKSLRDNDLKIVRPRYRLSWFENTVFPDKPTAAEIMTLCDVSLVDCMGGIILSGRNKFLYIEGMYKLKLGTKKGMSADFKSHIVDMTKRMFKVKFMFDGVDYSKIVYDRYELPYEVAM